MRVRGSFDRDIFIQLSKYVKSGGMLSWSRSIIAARKAVAALRAGQIE
jgi:hypothetical protein